MENSPTTKQLNDIYVLLHTSGYSKIEQQENQNWITFVSGKKTTRVCALKNKDGSNCCFIANRVQRAESHARSHQKNKLNDDIATISDVMSKFNLRETKKNIVLKQNSTYVTSTFTV